MPDPTGMELYSKLIELYDVKLQRFYIVSYHHVGESNVTPLLWMTDSAYADELMDASEP